MCFTLTSTTRTNIPARVTLADRILGCLAGIATGDAIGKQTETLSHEDVLQWYPHGIRGFEGTPGSVIPRYAGNAKHEWRIGETTDDTERTVAVARAIVTDRRVSHVSVGRELLRCTKCSVSTHGGSLAIAAAAATAAAVSAAIDAAAPHEVLELAERAAAAAERRWRGPTAAAFGDAVRIVHQHLQRLPALRAAEIASLCFPNQPLTIVPLALALGTLMQSAQDAILLAANIGGDSDSVASIAGAILGAMYPTTVDHDWYRVVEAVNDHKLVAIADALAQLRH